MSYSLPISHLVHVTAFHTFAYKAWSGQMRHILAIPIRPGCSRANILFFVLLCCDWCLFSCYLLRFSLFETSKDAWLGRGEVECLFDSLPFNAACVLEDSTSLPLICTCCCCCSVLIPPLKSIFLFRSFGVPNSLTWFVISPIEPFTNLCCSFNG